MICPICGYDIGSFDKECRKCKYMEKHPISKNKRNSNRSQLPAISKNINWLAISKAIGALIVVGLCFYIGDKCNENAIMNSLKLSTPEKTAVSAIYDLQSVVEVGVNFTKYGDYVIEAKQKINKAEKEDSQTKKRFSETKNCHKILWNYINAALEHYKNANSEWNDEIQSSHDVDDSTMQTKWSLAGYEIDSLDDFVEMRERKSLIYTNIDVIRTRILEILSSQISQARYNLTDS